MSPVSGLVAVKVMVAEPELSGAMLKAERLRLRAGATTTTSGLSMV